MGLSYPEQLEKGSAAPGRKWVKPLQTIRAPGACGVGGSVLEPPGCRDRSSMAEMKIL